MPPETQGASLLGACPLCPRVRSISLGPTPEEGCKHTKGGTMHRSSLCHQHLRTHQQCHRHAESLGWESLQDRRRDIRLALMYKPRLLSPPTTYLSRATKKIEQNINTSSAISLPPQLPINIHCSLNCPTMELPSCQGCGASTFSADEPSLLISYRPLGWRTHPSA